MASIAGWRALTIDGQWLDKIPACQAGFTRLQEAVVTLEGGGQIILAVDPTKGEQMYICTRKRISTGGSPPAEMPLFEIRNDPNSDRFVRLYLHPVLGPVFTTKDLDV